MASFRDFFSWFWVQRKKIVAKEVSEQEASANAQVLSLGILFLFIVVRSAGLCPPAGGVMLGIDLAVLILPTIWHFQKMELFGIGRTFGIGAFVLGALAPGYVGVAKTLEISCLMLGFFTPAKDVEEVSVDLGISGYLLSLVHPIVEKRVVPFFKIAETVLQLIDWKAIQKEFNKQESSKAKGWKLVGKKIKFAGVFATIVLKKGIFKPIGKFTKILLSLDWMNFDWLKFHKKQSVGERAKKANKQIKSWSDILGIITNIPFVKKRVIPTSYQSSLPNFFKTVSMTGKSVSHFSEKSMLGKFFKMLNPFSSVSDRNKELHRLSGDRAPHEFEGSGKSHELESDGESPKSQDIDNKPKSGG